MSEYFPDPARCPRHVLFPGIVTRTCWLDNLMLSHVRLEPRSVVPEHQHPHEQMGMILKGRVTFIIGGEEKTLQPGDWFRIPGNVRHKVVVLEEPAEVLDTFSPPREEYK